jgi:hypothetical protein
MAGKETGGLTKIDFIIGMPPITTRTGDPIHTQRSAEALKNMMPVATIYPGIPSFEFGIDLFNRVDTFFDGSHHDPTRTTNKNFYLPMLERHEYTLDTNIHNGGLQVAYIADNFPTDTFSNEYGENFLQKFTDVASEGAASISQMFGARDVRTLGSKMTAAAKKRGGIVGQAGQMAGKAGDYINELGKMFGEVSPAGSKMVSMIGSLAAGSRIDFPMVWKTSAFQPSYTMTIRLYNPNPGSLESTKKYIIGPIAAIMLLGIPISPDGSTYSWPFLHRVESPGIYNLDPAFIQNITIIKGGDQQQISWRQSLSMVDVRIDFGSLFSSMLASGDSTKKTRPTLKNYLKSMENQKLVYNITGGNLLDPKNNLNKPVNSQQVISGRNQQAFTKAVEILDAATPEDPPSRVSNIIKNIAEDLEDLIPDGFKISF